MQFTLSHLSSKSRARKGTLITDHGVVETPAFVAVGTKGTVKAVSPKDLGAEFEVSQIARHNGPDEGPSLAQFIFCNTYHLVISPGADLIQKAGGIHTFSGLNKPIITDSGGFQAFSLAFPNRKNMYELGTSTSPSPSVASKTIEVLNEDVDEGVSPTHLRSVRITKDGVEFRSHIDGTKYFFTPEFSIDVQKKIGADLIVAFDECIYNGATEAYTKKSTEQTHEWAKRSLEEFKKPSNKPVYAQEMYGVIQGGRFKDIRQHSTEFIASLPFFGIALGGVSVGETNQELRDEIDWISETLGTDPRPRHLLGISTIDDVLYAVAKGIDTFDCILPTRDARIGKIYQYTGNEQNPIETIDIFKAVNKQNLNLINEKALPGVTFAYLHHLFKQRELLAYNLATINNLWAIEQFFKAIRTQIEQDQL